MLKHKVAFITGAAQGIGLSIARKAVENGAHVMLIDKNEEELKKAVEQIKDLGFNSEGMVCDVTNEEELSIAIHSTLKSFGSLDILVNNAGKQHVAPIEAFSSVQFEELIKVMLTAPFYAIKHTLPIMKKQGYGRIINIASINGLIGFAGKAGYNSAKHGVIGLTKVTALEAAEYGITVNALCPGYVDTPLVRNQLEDLAKTRGITKERVLNEVIYPLVPQKRLLHPDEVGDYAVFLASDKAKGVTGQAVVMDGGYTAQ